MNEDLPNNNGGELVKVDHMAGKYGTGLNIRQVQWVGQVFSRSGLFSDSNDEAKAMVKIMAGQELGLAPFAAMNGINIIKGRPTMSGNLIAAAVKKSKSYDYRVTKSDDQECIVDWYEIDRQGNREKIGSNAFTIEMAKRAGLSFASDSNWSKYPQAMLFNRAISAGQKMYAPDVFMMPVYTPDEAEEFEGYIPPAEQAQPKTAGKRKKVTDTSQPINAEVLGGTQEPEDAPADEPFGDTTTASTDVDEPPMTDTEVIDEDTEQPLATATTTKVDQAFKDRVKKTLDSLDLKPQERMRLMRDSTGKVTPAQLTDSDWITFSNAIDDMMIAKADAETATETPLVNEEGKNGGKSENANENADTKSGKKAS